MGSLDYALRFPDRLRAFVLATSPGGDCRPGVRGIIERIVPPACGRCRSNCASWGRSYRARIRPGVERWLRIIHESGAEEARPVPFSSPDAGAAWRRSGCRRCAASDADLLAPPLTLNGGRFVWCQGGMPPGHDDVPYRG